MSVRRAQPKTPAQRGVAVVTALLLTTLAVTIVASLFWQQQVQVRSMENQRLQLQTKWILRGAMDWVQLILREDMKTPPQVDHPGEPWATGLAETRLDDYVEKDKNAPPGESTDAVLLGSVLDAQSRYNLANLATNTDVSKEELAVYAKLLESLQINTSLALTTAKAVAATQRKQQVGEKPLDPANPNPTPTPTPTPGSTIPGGKSDDKEPVTFTYLEDLLSIPGYTPEILQKLKNHVIFLPRVGTSLTPVNVNTASAEVLAARIPDLNLSVAKSLVADVKRGVYFKDVPDFRARRQDIQIKDGPWLSTTTNFFIVNGKVRLDRASLETQALLERGQHLPSGTRIIWIREN